MFGVGVHFMKLVPEYKSSAQKRNPNVITVDKATREAGAERASKTESLDRDLSWLNEYTINGRTWVGYQIDDDGQPVVGPDGGFVRNPYAGAAPSGTLIADALEQSIERRSRERLSEGKTGVRKNAAWGAGCVAFPSHKETEEWKKLPLKKRIAKERRMQQAIEEGFRRWNYGRSPLAVILHRDERSIHWHIIDPCLDENGDYAMSRTCNKQRLRELQNIMEATLREYGFDCSLHSGDHRPGMTANEYAEFRERQHAAEDAEAEAKEAQAKAEAAIRQQQEDRERLQAEREQQERDLAEKVEAVKKQLLEDDKRAEREMEERLEARVRAKLQSWADQLVKQQSEQVERQAALDAQASALAGREEALAAQRKAFAAEKKKHVKENDKRKAALDTQATAQATQAAALAQQKAELDKREASVMAWEAWADTEADRLDAEYLQHEDADEKIMRDAAVTLGVNVDTITEDAMPEWGDRIAAIAAAIRARLSAVAADAAAKRSQAKARSKSRKPIDRSFIPGGTTPDPRRGGYNGPSYG